MASRVGLVCLLLASLLGLGCEEWALNAREEHVLNRIGYGPDAWSRQRIRAIGIEGYIDEQLHPERLDDSALEWQLRRDYPLLEMSLPELREYFHPSHRRNVGEVVQQLSAARVRRAVHSKRQLVEVLVDFWFNHFNVDARGEIGILAVAPYERDAIRPHVLGRFEDMLRAVAREPAMLDYLDNAQNFREGFFLGGRSYGVNENFARELLELHTVGRDAGQTLRDIRHTALAFTGWTVARSVPGDARGFAFVAEGHDRSAKQILALSLPAGLGMEDGEAVIRYLARHPNTAVHIARKLCRRFIAEQPTGCEIAAASRFLATRGDLRAVMDEVLHSPEFWDPRFFRSKVKSPLRAIVSTARAVGVADDAQFAQVATWEVNRMGEGLYRAGPPTGWPEESSAWLGEGTFLMRLGLAGFAASGMWGLRAPAPLYTWDPTDVAATVTNRLLLGGAGPTTRAELVRFLTHESPSNRIREATALVLASPEFGHH